MHDAAEAYMGDICRPYKNMLRSVISTGLSWAVGSGREDVKQEFEKFRSLEERIQQAIYDKYQIRASKQLNTHVDNCVLAQELDICVGRKVDWPGVLPYELSPDMFNCCVGKGWENDRDSFMYLFNHLMDVKEKANNAQQPSAPQ